MRRVLFALLLAGAALAGCKADGTHNTPNDADMGGIVDSGVNDVDMSAIDLGASTLDFGMSLSDAATDASLADSNVVDAGPTMAEVVRVLSGTICQHHCPPLATAFDYALDTIQFPTLVEHANNLGVCEEFVTNALFQDSLNAVAAGRQIFNADEARACEIALESAANPTCYDAYRSIMPGACTLIFTGAIASGDVGCIEDSDCPAFNTCTQQACGAPGMCEDNAPRVVQTTPGQVCNLSVHPNRGCGSSTAYGPMDCEAFPDQELTACVASTAALSRTTCGMAVDETTFMKTYSYCPPYEYCNADSTCVLRDGPGDPCNAESQSCMSGFYCPLVAEGETPTCIPYPLLPLHANCNPAFEGDIATCDPAQRLICVQSAAGHGRVDAVCERFADGAAGDRCASSRFQQSPYVFAPCEQDFYCDLQSTCSPRIAPGLVCPRAGGLEDSCTAGYFCSSAYDNMCEPCPPP